MSIEIELRKEILELVIDDLVFAYAEKRAEAGDTEDVIEQFSVLDAVMDLLEEATHRAAHSGKFSSREAFIKAVHGSFDRWLEKAADCVELPHDSSQIN